MKDMFHGSIGSPVLFAAFIGFVLVMLALDLGVFHRKAHAVGMREAAIWSAVWVSLAAVFAGIVWVVSGEDAALAFTAGYVIEKALAVDNIFVFVVLFAALGVTADKQHRVLVWGIVGALIMRAIFIFAGGAFLERFEWATYVFGGILVVTGIKLVLERNEMEAKPEEGRIVRFLRRVPLFRRYPMLLAIAAIELSDVIFAVDSIPAVYAVTRDPFIVFTSNIFAILGLRSMYFLLANVVQKFRYLKLGLSAVLVFVGAKMLLADVVEVPIVLSLGVIVLILGAAGIASALYNSAMKDESKLAATRRR
jgi:tellurite resistance protein TerC